MPVLQLLQNYPSTILTKDSSYLLINKRHITNVHVDAKATTDIDWFVNVCL